MGSFRSKLGWLALIWLLSVGFIAAVAGVLRYWIAA